MATTTPPREEHVRQIASPDTSPSVSNNALKVATIGGIQIFVDWTWLLAFAFFTWSLGAYYDTTFHSWGHGTAYLIGALSTLLLFVTVLLHELGHSFTARSLGLPVNSITLFIFGGVSNLTTEPQTPRVEFLVTFAGPLTSLILAGNRFHQLPVVEQGRLVGMLNRDHVMQYLQLRQLQSRHDGSGGAGDEKPTVGPPTQKVG